MNKQILSFFVVFLAVGRVHGEVNIVNMDTIPKIIPQIITTQGLEDTTDNQFNNLKWPEEGSRILQGDDANDVYNKNHPFPDMHIIVTKPPQYLFSPDLPGVEYVEGFREHWPHGIINEAQERTVVWQWQVPSELKDSWPAWGHPSIKDRYAGLVLYPTDWKYRDPTLCVFDGVSGLIWQKEMPLRATVQQVKESISPSNDPNAAAGYTPKSHDVSASITDDGSHVLVLVPRPDLNLSALFIYGADGTLLHTVIFPGQDASASNNLRRTPSGKRFLLQFFHKVSIPLSSGQKASRVDINQVLADEKGNVICQFVDDAGRADAPVSMLSTDEKYARGAGNNKKYLYIVPSSPITVP